MLTTALGRSPPDPELIYEAMKDRIHQPYRKELARGSFDNAIYLVSPSFVVDSRATRGVVIADALLSPGFTGNLLVWSWANDFGSGHG